MLSLTHHFRRPSQRSSPQPSTETSSPVVTPRAIPSMTVTIAIVNSSAASSSSSPAFSSTVSSAAPASSPPSSAASSSAWRPCPLLHDIAVSTTAFASSSPAFSSFAVSPSTAFLAISQPLLLSSASSSSAALGRPFVFFLVAFAITISYVRSIFSLVARGPSSLSTSSSAWPCSAPLTPFVPIPCVLIVSGFFNNPFSLVVDVVSTVVSIAYSAAGSAPPPPPWRRPPL